MIEGIEAQKYRYCVGVQWHPEFLIPGRRRLFKNFSAPRQPNRQGRVSEPERIASAWRAPALLTRRDAERWIADGRVQVDGVVLERRPSSSPTRARIEATAPCQATGAAVALSQAAGELVTERDPQNRRTIFDPARACPVSPSAASISFRACC